MAFASSAARARRRTPFLLALAAIAAGGLLSIDSRPGGEAPVGAVTASAPAPQSGPAEPDDEVVAESLPDRVRAPDAEPPPLGFRERVDALVATSLEVARLAESGEEAAAVELDREVRAAFAALVGEVPDSDHLALAELGSPLADEPSAPLSPVRAADVRRSILAHTVGAGLARRHARRDDGGADATRLTAGVLAVLEARSELAEPLGREFLVDRPYLELSHEEQVLGLVAASVDGSFPADVATALLSTLWHNLQRTGVRSSSQLAGLALLLLDDGNASERLAASRLLVADERYRRVLLDHLLRTRDRELARAVAMAAAQELPEAVAFEVVTTTSEVLGPDAAPFLTLAVRSPGLLAREYEHRLGSDVEPRLRALLVTGAGFAGAGEGLELAQLALANDPDPEVRMRALFVLTGAAASTLGEAAIQVALDDPRIGSDPQRLGAIVLALQNLARAGQTNAVDRIGTRLRATAALDASSRELLEGILRESLPGRVAETRVRSGGDRR